MLFFYRGKTDKKKQNIIKWRMNNKQKNKNKYGKRKEKNEWVGEERAFIQTPLV